MRLLPDDVFLNTHGLPRTVVGVSDWWDGVADWWDGKEPAPAPGMQPNATPVPEELSWVFTTLEVVIVILAVLAALVMLWGVARTVAMMVGVEVSGCKDEPRGNALAVMGYYLGAGLDILIVASLIALSIAPTFPSLGLVGGLAGVRLVLACVTFLERSPGAKPVTGKSG